MKDKRLTPLKIEKVRLLDLKEGDIITGTFSFLGSNTGYCRQLGLVVSRYTTILHSHPHVKIRWLSCSDYSSYTGGDTIFYRVIP